jgi:hypothetical protein
MAKRILDLSKDANAIRNYLIDYYKEKLGEEAVNVALGKLE